MSLTRWWVTTVQPPIPLLHSIFWLDGTFSCLFSRSSWKIQQCYSVVLIAVLTLVVGLPWILVKKRRRNNVLKWTDRQVYPLKHRFQNRTAFPDKFTEGGRRKMNRSQNSIVWFLLVTDKQDQWNEINFRSFFIGRTLSFIILHWFWLWMRVVHVQRI